MKVGELVALLQKFQPDEEVRIEGARLGEATEIETVDLIDEDGPEYVMDTEVGVLAGAHGHIEMRRQRFVRLR